MRAGKTVEDRLDARLFRVTHEVQDGNGNTTAVHSFEIQVGLDCAGKIVEIAFAERGKVGHGIDVLLADAGLWVSRILQNRDPETGDPLVDSGIGEARPYPSMKPKQA